MKLANKIEVILRDSSSEAEGDIIEAEPQGHEVEKEEDFATFKSGNEISKTNSAIQAPPRRRPRTKLCLLFACLIVASVVVVLSTLLATKEKRDGGTCQEGQIKDLKDDILISLCFVHRIQ